MCGDGANDLMAIREADVGVAISDSDASYGASFSITKMLQVDHIIRESKNTSQAIVDTFRYYGTTSFLKLTTAILLVSDVTYYGGNQAAYYNFAHSIFLAVFMNLSSPAEAPTKRRPVCNMMSLENHIIYWANIIFPTAGFCAAYFYFYNSPAYIPNPLQVVSALKGYLGVKCTTTTILWLMINIPFILNAFFIYNSFPFKCGFFSNILLMVLFVANLIPAIVFFFVTGLVTSGLALVSIPNEQTGGVLGILSIFMVASLLFNHFYQKLFVK
jgi:cation-transporting ATPase 13A3/4/5